MCSDCGKTFCPIGCPSEEVEVNPHCAVCGAETYAEEAYTFDGKKIFCPYCIDNMELCDVMDTYGISGIKELIAILTAAE